MDPPQALEDVREHLETLQLSAFLMDREWRLWWVSPELRTFLGDATDDDLGVGAHIGQALGRDIWLREVHPESRSKLLDDAAPLIARALIDEGHDLSSTLPPRLRDRVGEIEPGSVPPVWSTSFRSLFRTTEEARGDEVNMLFLRLPGDIGWLALFFIGVRPTLLALLGRGDPRTYERMARLIEPGHRTAAILFCDLHGSGVLSRRLPTAAYFRLVRRLWTQIDNSVVDNAGIIGKHAGDGATAFFLADELGSPSAAVVAAVRTARRIHDLSTDVFRDVADSDCLMKVAIHWGANLFMGQLVPGGRLDITALGDEVNETARIEQATGPHQTMASKQLIEQLEPQAAEELGLDPATIRYEILSELSTGNGKVERDAGAIAVTRLPVS